MAESATQDFGIKAHKGEKTTPTIEVKKASSETTTEDGQNDDDVPLSLRNFKNPFSRQHTKLHVDDYFVSSSMTGSS
jgi:hypothetical protein